MGLTVRWDITNRCNLRCKHCSAYDEQYKMNNDELSTREVFEIIEKLSNEKIDCIKLLGGEPLLRDDLDQIISAAFKKNIPIGLTTNGTIPFNSKLQECIISEKIRYITFSIDSENDRLNATLRPVDTVRIVKENIEKLNSIRQKHKLPLKIALNSVINNKNYLNCYSMLEFAVMHQIDKISFSNLVPRGRGKHLTNLIATPQQLIQASLIISDFFQKKGDLITIEPSYAPALLADFLRIKYKKEFPSISYRCRASTELCYINASGLLFPCETIQQKYVITNNNLLLHSFRDIWNSSEFNGPFRDVESGAQYNMNLCNKCKYRFKTCYPCINWSMKPQICELINQEMSNIFEEI